MSVRFKFRSEREYDTVVFDGAFVSVGELKRLIAEKRRLDEDAANELVLSTVQGVDYRDDAEQLPKSSSVLVKRAPALRSRAGARPQQQGPATQVQAPAAAAPARAAEPVSLPQLTRNAAATDAAASADPLKAAEAAAAAYAQEGDLIDSIVSGSASQWESGATVAAGGRGRGMGGRGGAPGMGAAPGRGMFMRGAVPPPNYLCGRCGQFGHYLRDCPTQGDPDFDMKRVRLPAGIPSTMLKRAPDGGILLPDGQTGFLQANKDALEKERQFLPTMADAGGDSAFGSGSAPTAKDPAQGMFDDEDLPPVAAAKAVPLGIGMIEAAAPPSDPDQLAIVPVAQPTAAQQQQQPATAAAPSTAPRGRPGAMSSDEFSAALRWLDDFMPRAPPDALARAFNRAAPLPPGDFRALQAELAAAAAAGRRGGSPGAGPLGPPGPAAAHRGLPPHNREPSPSGRGYPLERDWQPGQPGGPGPYGREPPLLHRYPGPGGERYEERFRPPYFEDRRRPPSPGRRPMRFGGDGGGPPFDRRPPFDDRRPYDGPPPGRDYPAGRFHDRPGPDYARDRFAPGAYRPAERFVDGDRPPAFERRPSDRSLDSRVYPDAVPARERSPNRPRRPEERPGGSPGPLGRSGSGSQRAADLPGRPQDHPRERSRGEERLRRDAEEERLKSRGGSGRGGEERPASRNGGDREHSGERDERRGRTAGRERPQQSPSLEQPRSGEKRRRSPSGDGGSGDERARRAADKAARKAARRSARDRASSPQADGEGDALQPGAAAATGTSGVEEGGQPKRGGSRIEWKPARGAALFAQALTETVGDKKRRSRAEADETQEGRRRGERERSRDRSRDRGRERSERSGAEERRRREAAGDGDDRWTGWEEGGSGEGGSGSDAEPRERRSKHKHKRNKRSRH